MDEVLSTLNRKLQASNRHKQCTEQYVRLQSDEDRVIFTMNLLGECDMLIDIKNNENKCILKSRKFNDEANKRLLCANKGLNLDSVVEFYTKSVAYAPIDSQELAFAYANRSAALFKAALYDDCINDINRALNLNYPDKWKAKLYARKVRCQMILYLSSSNSSTESLKFSSELTDLPSNIGETLNQVKIWLEKMELDDSGRSNVEKTLNNPLKMAASVKRPFIKLLDQRNCPEIPKDNLEIPGATSAVELKYCEKFGKHVVATRNIEIGDIIAVQEAYASVLVFEKCYTHCWNCLQQCWSGISCQGCVYAIFCSEFCYNDACNEYHDLECKVIGPLIALGMNNLVLMSLRLAIKVMKEVEFNFEVLHQMLREIDSASDIRTNGFIKDILNDKKYASVYTLAKNTEKRSVPDLFGRSLNAAFIVYIISKKTDIFGDKYEGDIKDLKNHKCATFIGGLIMRHLQIIPSNVHSVTQEGMHLIPEEKAAAIMPFYSLINHSCNPMVERQSFGNKIALIAITPIKKDHQIFDNYGLHYAITSKPLRQQKLKQQYHFDCLCEACEQNWPLYGHFGSYIDQKLKKDINKKLFNVLKNFDEYYDIVRRGNIDDHPTIVDDLVKILKVLYQYVSLPCMEVNKVLETLKKVYSLRGNRFLSIN